MIEHDPSTVEEGWEVCGVDGQKIGSVKSSQAGALVVESGTLFKSELYVPVSYIEGIAQERVTLSVTSDKVEAMGWDKPMEERTVTDENAQDQAPGSARIGTSEPDMQEPVATTGSRDRAGSTSVAAQATEPTGDQTAPVARPADALKDSTATRADTTTMTGAGYGAGAGASSAGGLGARSGPDAQADRAGGSGRGGTSDLAPPAETQERPKPG
jgi:hypothetical protein